MKKFIAVLTISVAILGCSKIQPVTENYVKNDLRFEKTFSPVMEKWIAGDTELSDTEKQSLMLAFRAWQLAVATAADDLAIPHEVAP